MNPVAKSGPGFSLVEVLVVVAVLGLVTAVVVPNIRGGPDAAKKAKLEQDIVIVNNAIAAYVAADGSANAAARLTPNNVINTLKQRVSGSGITAEMTGSLGPFLDPRVVTNASDFAWSARWVPGDGEERIPPRFEIQNSPDGVVFGLGLPSAVAPATAANTGWLWSYSAAAAQPVSKPVYEPGTIDSLTTLGTTNPLLTLLAPPVITPPTGSITLTNLPFAVTVANNNPAGSSVAYYKRDNNPWLLFAAPFTISQPGANPSQIEVEARAYSIDPSRYRNSDSSFATYTIEPLNLALQITPAARSFTYAEASSSQTATISLNLPGLVSVFRNSANFEVYYTTDGTDPVSSPTKQAAPGVFGSQGHAVPIDLVAWGAGSTLQIRAVAVTKNTAWFNSSQEANVSYSITPTQLDPPVITPAPGNYFGSFNVGITTAASSPADTTVFYTTDGGTPANGTGTSFANSTSFRLGPLSFGQSATVRAVAVGPASYTQWFLPSQVASALYRGPNFNYGGISGGVLISSGTIAQNAQIQGSVVIASTGTPPNVRFNNNAVVTGDLYAPGTPNVQGLAPSRVVALDGDINPAGYPIIFDGNATFGGTVYTRITPVPMPTVTVPGNLPSQTFLGGTLVGGVYNSVALQNNATITLGVAGATEPTVYSFKKFVVRNNVTVNVVGPVILYLDLANTDLVDIKNGAVLGNQTRPDWLQIRMADGNLSLGNNGTLYGSVLGPNSVVTFEPNSVFNGGVTAQTFNMENNGSGITFSLPPPQ